MNKYKCAYSSMTAYYNLGEHYGETKEEVEKKVRAKQTAFSQSEKRLITCWRVDK